MNFQMFKVIIEKLEEPGIKLPTCGGKSKKQESSRNTSPSTLLTMPKALTVCNMENYESDGNTRMAS